MARPLGVVRRPDPEETHIGHLLSHLIGGTHFPEPYASRQPVSGEPPCQVDLSGLQLRTMNEVHGRSRGQAGEHPDEVAARRHRRRVLPAFPGPLADRLEASELLDEGDHPHEELCGTFRDMRRVNRLLGGTAITIRGIQRLSGHLRPGNHLSILDVGTGHADIPADIIDWATRRGLTITATGLDIDIATLHSGQQFAEQHGIVFVAGDNLDLPLRDQSVDIAMSSMTLHHFDDDQAIQALREMARVSRLGIIVNDLLRTAHGFVVAWLLGRIATRNRLTRHDAHLSIRRSRTISEMAALARAAGLQQPVFDTTLGYRAAMTIGVRQW
jgi:2-polyprenyl-3-methyl-5-hydroxy-6-metoxy-1,4-benzoquinol methylase